MLKSSPKIFSHFMLISGLLLMIVPIWMIFASSTHTNSTIRSEGMQLFIGENFIDNYDKVLNIKGGFSQEITATSMLINSFIMAIGIATLTVVTSLMSAFAIVYFKFKLAIPFFWLIFITILVPLELRIMPSYQVVSDLGLTNSYAGLILPLSASAIATFFFRQFYLSIPDELLEAAKLDGANSWKFFIDFLIPLSKTMITAVFIFMFIYGYNQYLWPLIMTTSEKYWTVVMGMKMLNIRSSVEGYAYIILSMLPPVLVIIILQRYFIQGLFQSK
ncbi:ABC transporter permease subunit [Alphaproteobacteria bacterium]|jgi:sn-glycerol 3-phosphate transport system permease protein|nr:ABC transporter permease subunit [Alphaproteobacteria bacterium]MDC0497935.1 ABC transporter permease subunit [Alphaproteobacteria bacterium]|tara:strand:- start:564 stop:1388 length:825 start_codon:yes stop_codon:yes gene_type:complete